MNKKLSTKAYASAMIFILILGLVSLGGLYYFLNFYSPSSKTNSSVENGPVTKEPTSLTLDLTSPDDEVLSFSQDLEISGKTSPGSEILISSADNDMVISSKPDGAFTGDFNLSEGTNQIKIVVFDKNGDQKEVDRTVYYSKEKI